jgi:hypothetical protein
MKLSSLAFITALSALAIPAASSPVPVPALDTRDVASTCAALQAMGRYIGPDGGSPEPPSALIMVPYQGGMLVYGGELSDMGRRITWMILALSVMMTSGHC